MLDPSGRTLYADSLRPPPGRVFDQGIATTYSLGLDTLLTVPLQLALFDRRDSESALEDSIAVLEALRRTSKQLSIYCQQGQIHVPRRHQVLFSLLEPIVHEVRAPGGGAFHAKLWVMRFVDPAGVDPPSLRVLILSRNLTFDRSWDLSLQLEGTRYQGRQSPSRPLANLVRALPGLAASDVSEKDRQRAESLAEDIDRTRFELPPGFDDVNFHVHGLGGRRWKPGKSDQIAVISPFCDDSTLIELAESSRSPLLLVSRSDELDCLAAETRSKFSQTRILNEAAETEDGEDTSDDTSGETKDAEDTSEHASRLRGLHAKVYLQKVGWDTRIVMGSANATRPGLTNEKNVEILAVLSGKASRVGKVEAVLEKGGFGDLLVEYHPPEQRTQIEAAEKTAEEALDAARKSLGEGGLTVRCRYENETYGLALSADAPIDLSGIQDLRAWPITKGDGNAVPAMSLAQGQKLDLGPCALQSITGLIAFEMTARIGQSKRTRRIRFVLNLPLQDLPEERDAAITRTVISNQAGFLRYLALLLAELGDDPLAGGGEAGEVDWGRVLTKVGGDDWSLLEPLIRALARDPEKLNDVSAVIKKIRGKADTATNVIPAEFLELWCSFEIALATMRKRS